MMKICATSIKHYPILNKAIRLEMMKTNLDVLDLVVDALLHLVEVGDDVHEAADDCERADERHASRECCDIAHITAKQQNYNQ